MTKLKFLLVILLSAFAFNFCQSQSIAQQNVDTAKTNRDLLNHVPNFNYEIEAPAGWTIRDTIMQDGLRVRFLLPPQSLMADYPAGNALLVFMAGKAIDDFVAGNMDYLKEYIPGITILEKGSLDSSLYNCKWYTYIKEQNGIAREMINYIIPLNGFAYMITCGTNKGSMYKYRHMFDEIAKSFKG